MAEIESEEEFYIRQLEKHVDKSKENKEHAIKRLDILMVSLSALGLGFVTNYIKDLTCIDLTFAYLSQILFIICVLINVLSHIFAVWTNTLEQSNATAEMYWYRDKYLESRETKKEIQHDENNEEDVKHKTKKDKLEIKILIYDTVIKYLNISSFVTLLGSLISFIYFIVTS